jgi:hypothetical protein
MDAREWEFILEEVQTTTGILNYLGMRYDLDLEQPFGQEKEVLGLLGMMERDEEVGAGP